jgi:hypothetical protein
MGVEDISRTIIGKAELATSDAQERIRRAGELLGDSGSINAVGLFMNPQQRLASLLSAKAEIEAAAARIAATGWPSTLDYDNAGY